LVNLGAYEKGHNKRADYAVDMIDELGRFLRQNINISSSMEIGLKEMAGLLSAKVRPEA